MIAFKIRLFYLLHCNTNITAFQGHILKMHSYNGRLNIALEILSNLNLLRIMNRTDCNKIVIKSIYK